MSREGSLPIQAPVTDGFGEVLGQVIVATAQVTYSPGDLNDLVVCSCREPQFVNGLFEQAFAFRGEMAETFQLFVGHLGVGENAFLPEPSELSASGGLGAFADYL